MAEKLRQAPVFYTLAQVRFNPIAQMEEYVPHLQDRLRRGGFPDFKAEHLIGIGMRQVDDREPDVRTTRQCRWSFANLERTEGYLLSTDTLVFHTTAYDVFPDFLTKTRSGLELLHDIVGLSYIGRVGLRYLDAVVPLDSDTLDRYLTPSLLGLSGAEGIVQHSFAETVLAKRGGTLVARTLIREGDLALPPDLFPLTLEIQPRFAGIKGRHAVLDTDFFVEGRWPYSPEDVANRFDTAHQVIEEAFRASVSPYAFEKWR